MKISNILTKLIATVLFIFVAHAVAALLHEYSHSTMAWILGFKQNPFDIQYGGTHWLNLLTLSGIDEKVNYTLVYLLGHPYEIALIACAGPLIGNGLFYLLSLYGLSRDTVKKRPLLFNFLFWFNLMSLGNLYGYIPIRVFTHGDMGNVVFSLNISPWWIMIIGGYLVLFAVVYFYKHTLVNAYHYFPVNSIAGRVILLSITVFLMFFFFGGGYLSSYYGPVTRFMSTVSDALIPAVIYLCWPGRSWVKNAFERAQPKPMSS